MLPSPLLLCIENATALSVSYILRVTTHTPDGLLSLGLSHFRFLVTFLQDLIESSTLNSSVELNVASSRSLLGCLFLRTLFMLSSVQDGPSCVTRISSHKVRLLSFTIGEVEYLMCVQKPSKTREFLK